MPYRQNFPIPAVIDPPKTCLQIEIPDHPDWKAVISGVLFELSYWFNWERTGDTSGAQCAAVWKQVYNSIDWGDMSCCCEEKAVIVRVNPATGRVEQSTDGGVTWQPQPGGLPSLIVNPAPPVTSGVAATKCDAATNVSGQVQVWIDQVSNDFTTAISLLEFGTAVLEAILIAVVTILSAGTLTAAEALVLPTIAAALYAAWGAGKTIFDDYWSTDVKDKILCAVFCNIGDDGSFNDAQFSATWNEINSQLPASPAKMLFMGFLSSVGIAGMNAMAATGMSADADCSDCVECLECPEFFELYDALGTGVSRGDGWIEVSSVFSYVTGGYETVGITTNDSLTCCFIDHIEVGGVTTHFLSAWAECGEAVPAIGAGFPHGGSTEPFVSINSLLIYQAAPFTARIFLHE